VLNLPSRSVPSGMISAHRRETVVVAHLDRERMHAESLPGWRAWLLENHDKTDGVWLVSWRSVTGKPRVTYEEAVQEALAVGWVDGPKRTIDEDRSMLWFARRKPTSAWSRLNKERIARLQDLGRLLPAGREAVAVAKANGTWTMLDDVENLVVPADLDLELAARPGARDRWDGFPRSARRAMLEWIVQARTAPTRTKRVNETAAKAACGERANQWPRS